MKKLYLVAYYSMKPAARVRTQKAGWKSDPKNISWDERVAVTSQLRNRDLSESQVILDLINKTVIRNSWDNTKSYEHLWRYFQKNYPKYFSNPASISVENPDSSSGTTVSSVL